MVKDGKSAVLQRSQQNRESAVVELLRKLFVRSSELLKRYNQPTPRYTSYPPVPLWKPAQGDMLVSSLQRSSAPLSVYVHLFPHHFRASAHLEILVVTAHAVSIENPPRILSCEGGWCFRSVLRSCRLCRDSQYCRQSCCTEECNESLSIHVNRSVSGYTSSTRVYSFDSKH